MDIARAQLSNYRQSPRKVGLLAGLVRGRSVAQALMALDVAPKRGAAPFAKLIRSAVANARAKGLSEKDLVISKVTVGKGVVFRRYMPRARGSVSPIQKKASHITVELTARPAKTKKAKAPRAKKIATAEAAAQ